MPIHKTSMDFIEEPIPFRIQVTKAYNRIHCIRTIKKTKGQENKETMAKNIATTKTKALRLLPFNEVAFQLLK